MKQTLLILTFLFTTIISWCQAGRIDRTFGHRGAVNTHFNQNAFLHKVAIQPDQKIVAAGTAGSDAALTRYNTDGTLDNSFGVGGRVITDLGNTEIITAVAIQPDGKIIAAGFNEFFIGPNIQEDIIVIRYNTNGTPDSSFGTNGIVITSDKIEDFGLAVTIQTDGKIIVAGGSDNYGPGDILLLRYNTNGSLDNTFGTGGKVTTGYDDSVNTYDGAEQVVLQPDGKILIAGVTEKDVQFFPLNNVLIRYNTDGSLDNSFGINGKAPFLSTRTWVHTLSLQQNGKIIISGFTLTADNYNEGILARYNANGTIDNTYGNNGIIYTQGINGSSASEIFSTVVQADGKLVAGGFTNYTDLLFVRYKATGIIDSSYGTNGITTYVNFGLSSYDGDPVCSLARQSDGNIVVGTVVNHNFSLSRLTGGAGALTAINNNLPVRIYPNPVATSFVVAGLDKTSAAIVTITDVSGNVLKMQKLQAGTCSINVSTFKQGRYIAVFTQNNKTGSVKFIKQ